MIKILFLINNLSYGGAERVLVNLANNMDSSQFDVTVKTLFDEGVNRKFLSDKVRYIPGLKRSFKGNSVVFKLLPPKLLYRFFVREHYDIVVSYLEGSCTRIISACPDQNTKKVAWVHIELNGEKHFSKPFLSLSRAQRAYKRFDKIICVSHTVERELLNSCGLDRLPTEVLYNTNETERIKRLSLEQCDDFTPPPDVPNICSVGKIHSTKGYDRLLNVHKRLIDEGYMHRIYLIGVGKLESELRARAAELGLEQSFVLLGFKENPYKYIRKCDMFVCSSRREGFSTAVTEALILGLAVVSTCCSGAYELLGENNEYGIVTPNSEDGIYEAMKFMLINREYIERYSDLAAERGKQFSRDKTVSEAERMFSQLMDTKE